jgi:hypothetical protein
VPSNSTELFITIIAPTISWVGLGFGASMKQSLMFLLYPSSNSSYMTLSPRQSHDNVEPTFWPEVEAQLLPSSGIVRDNDNNPYWAAYIACYNCRTAAAGVLDVTSKQQEFIYAVGPGSAALASDSPAASLQQHVAYGAFTLDMVHATGDISGPPVFDFTGDSSQFQGGTDLPQDDKTNDRDVFSHAHAFLSVFAVLIVLPVGIIFIGVFKSKKWHMINSILFLLLLVSGFALGIVDSKRYNDTKDMKSPHQVMGIISTVLFMLLFATGFVPRFLSTSTSGLPHKLHMYFSILAILLAVVTGGLGLQLSAGDMTLTAAYVAVLIAVTILL